MDLLALTGDHRGSAPVPYGGIAVPASHQAQSPLPRKKTPRCIFAVTLRASLMGDLSFQSEVLPFLTGGPAG